MSLPRRRPLNAASLPLLLVVSAASRSAWAFELWGTGPLANSTIQTTEDFELRYHSVDEALPGFEDRPVLDYVEQVNRLNLLLASPNAFSAGVQIDEVALWGNRYFLDGEEVIERDLLDPALSSPWQSAYVRLEKYFFQKKWTIASADGGAGGGVDLTLGDTYASFGRGIALNIVKNTDIDIDTSIRGAKAIVRGGPMEVTLVSGLTNRQQISQDNPNTRITDDIQHMVSGARIEHFALGPFQAGVHGVIYRFGRDDLAPGAVRYSEPLDVVAAGATTGVAAGGVDLFLEGDLFRYRSEDFGEGADGLTGYATYGSASFYPGRSVFLIEAKKTQDTERINTFVSPDLWEVSNTPTLEYERVITEDSSSAVNSNDLTGARIRMDYALTPGVLTPYASVAGFLDEDLSGSHFNQSPETIGHGMVGIQWLKESWVLQANGGYRADVREAADEGADRMAHMDGEVHVPLFTHEGGHDALELIWAVQSFQWGNNEGQQSDFVQTSNALSYYRGDSWVFVLYQDYSDNPLVETTGNLDDDLYGAAEIQWKPGDATKLRLFYGSYMAGIKCSGGQCRKLPGFEGARLSFNGTF